MVTDEKRIRFLTAILKKKFQAEENPVLPSMSVTRIRPLLDDETNAILTKEELKECMKLLIADLTR